MEFGIAAERVVNLGNRRCGGRGLFSKILFQQKLSVRIFNERTPGVVGFGILYVITEAGVARREFG